MSISEITQAIDNIDRIRINWTYTTTGGTVVRLSGDVTAINPDGTMCCVGQCEHGHWWRESVQFGSPAIQAISK